MSWCFKQVCQARPRIATCQKSVLNYSPKPVEISVHRPCITSRTSWKIFSRKCWFIKTQTFRGNRPVLMKGFLCSKGEKSENRSREAGTSPGRGTSSVTQSLTKNVEDQDLYLQPQVKQMRGCNLFLHILKRQPLTIKLYQLLWEMAPSPRKSAPS